MVTNRITACCVKPSVKAFGVSGSMVVFIIRRSNGVDSAMMDACSIIYCPWANGIRPLSRPLGKPYSWENFYFMKKDYFSFSSRFSAVVGHVIVNVPVLVLAGMV